MRQSICHRVCRLWIGLLPGYRVALVRTQEDDRHTGYRVALVQSTHRSGYRVALVRKRRKAQHHGYRQVLVRVWKALRKSFKSASMAQLIIG
jgi:hypothetical protein